MLFSNEPLAAFINQNFEPTWQSLRPVPIVRIDFGNGHAITRTLHGNIATYVCSPAGQVLDILPGIYTPAVYQDALDQLRILARNYAVCPAEQRTALVRSYHERSALALKKGAEPERLVDLARLVAVGKRRIERPVELVLARPTEKPRAEEPQITAAEDLASWNALKEDTRINEKARRLLIHEKLAPSAVVQPEQVCKWLYKEVLHADLDDPYLGLGKVLFSSDPFYKGEQTR